MTDYIMKKINRKKGPVVSKKVIYDGITFASGLEKFMYKLLKENKIVFKYEAKTYELIPSFLFENDCYERQSNGKGDFINRGNKKVLNLKYTPEALLNTKGLFFPPSDSEKAPKFVPLFT